jgi:hypothetical protein
MATKLFELVPVTKELPEGDYPAIYRKRPITLSLDKNNYDHWSDAQVFIPLPEDPRDARIKELESRLNNVHQQY